MPIHSLFGLKQTYNYFLTKLVKLFSNTLANEGKKPCLSNDRIAEAARHNFYTCTSSFIHLLGSSLIQWMNVRIKGREEPKQDLQVRIGEAMPCLGGEVRLGREVRLGEALLRLGGPKSAEFLGSGPPRCSDLLLGGALRLGVHSYA